ncbi:hypothetical protein GIV75_10400 [Pseudomonas sp. PA-3-5D]|uniref:plasmid mobilization protein n=2 Tax=Pseudomonas TaxID=286 RepID=UPI001F3F6B05|nr:MULTISPECIES: hypothetical protein [unclassified Pseudomonas]MCF5508839.1 hypothetical protein [Pseudomonas sp. PA-3-6H]MCF5561289.1 hypothetical protein [Pseudomonas sp. PA-3-5D]
MSNKKRNGEQFNIRISKEAKDSIVANATLLKISQAKYIEQLALDGCKIIEIRNDEFVRYMDQQEANLRMLGNNLNQIAAAINSGRANMANENISVFEKAKKAFDKYYLVIEQNTQKIELTK